ncbi:MAG: cell surface protein, partial [Psychrobacillus sp.]
MKKKAIKIAASTAVAASAFVAAAPAQQADAATNVNQLATNAQNAGTVLKWAISYEGSADFKTRPFDEFNAAKKAVATAEAAANKLPATEKLSVQAKLVDAKVQIVRATAYIDAITSSEKIKSLTSNLTAATATGDLAKVETAYHAASFEYKKQAKLLDRVYGQSTRDGIRNAVKPAMESALDAVKYDVTV